MRSRLRPQRTRKQIKKLYSFNIGDNDGNDDQKNIQHKRTIEVNINTLNLLDYTISERQ